LLLAWAFSEASLQLKGNHFLVALFIYMPLNKFPAQTHLLFFVD
jgi:hypothetical protein